MGILEAAPAFLIPVTVSRCIINNTISTRQSNIYVHLMHITGLAHTTEFTTSACCQRLVSHSSNIHRNSHAGHIRRFNVPCGWKGADLSLLLTVNTSSFQPANKQAQLITTQRISATANVTSTAINTQASVILIQKDV